MFFTKSILRAIKYVFFIYETFILLYINFSKILFKLDSQEIGVKLFCSVSSSALNVGMIFDILSLVGYVTIDIDELKFFAKK